MTEIDDPTAERKSEKGKESAKVPGICYSSFPREQKQTPVVQETEVQLPPEIEEKPISEVLPADFFDNKVEGALALGVKPKAIEKEIKQYMYRDGITT